MASKRNRSRGTNHVNKPSLVDPKTQMAEKEMSKDGVPSPKKIQPQDEKMSPLAKAFHFMVFFSVIVVFLVVYVKYLWPIPEAPLPSFSLSQAHPYEYKFTTVQRVNFYVQSSGFEEEYPVETYVRDKIESLVDRKYVSFLQVNCADELLRKNLGLTTETPHCVMAYQFDPDLAASLLRSRRGYN